MPDAVRDVHTDHVTERSVHVDWHRAGSGVEPTGYRVYDQTGKRVYNGEKEDATFARVEDLEPDTEYTFTVKPVAADGEEGPPATGPPVKTLAEKKEEEEKEEEKEEEEATPVVPTLPAVRNVAAKDVTPRSVVLDWDRAGEGEEPVEYVVYEEKSGKKVRAGSTATVARIEDLEPDTYYTFSVKPVAEGGNEGAPATTSVHTKDEEAPPVEEEKPAEEPKEELPEAVRNVHFDDLKSRSVVLDWERAGAGPEAAGYNVYDQTGRKVYAGPDNRTTVARLEPLEPETEYVFTVRPVSDEGKEGDEAKSEQITTPADPSEADKAKEDESAAKIQAVYRGRKTRTSVQPVRNLEADAVTEDSARINWRAPAGGPRVVSYNVYTNGTLAKSGDARSLATLDGLTPDTEYEVTVKPVYKDDRVGPSDDELKIKTLAKDDRETASDVGVAEYLRFDNVTEREVQLDWNAPDKRPASYIVYDKKSNARVYEGKWSKAELTGLEPDTEYVFDVACVSENGVEGDRVSSPAVRTLKPAEATVPAAPPAPEVKLTRGETGKLDVLVRPTADDGGDGVLGYRLFDADTGEAVHEDNELVYVLDNREAGKTHTFFVRAFNGIGESADSPKSAPVTIAAVVEPEPVVDAGNAEAEEAAEKLAGMKPSVGVVIENSSGHARVRVVSCRPGGAFAEAGVPEGCYCTHVMGVSVSTNTDFKSALKDAKPGDMVEFTFYKKPKAKKKGKKAKEPEPYNQTLMIGAAGVSFDDLRDLLRKRDGQ